jgi:FkbM family methyltransferase
MSILIDCGTNFKQGLIEMLSLYPDIQKVYSFEANRHVYDLLDKNDGNFYFNLAVLDRTGFSSFYAEKAIGTLQGGSIHGQDRFIGGGSRLQDPRYACKSNFTDSNELEKFVDDMYDEIIVPTIRLIDFIDFLNVEDNSIVLKLDVEGAEYQILKDMEKSNVFNKIKKLHVEFHEWGRKPEYDDNRYWVDYFNKNNIDYVSTGMMV